MSARTFSLLEVGLMKIILPKCKLGWRKYSFLNWKRWWIHYS